MKSIDSKVIQHLKIGTPLLVADKKVTIIGNYTGFENSTSVRNQPPQEMVKLKDSYILEAALVLESKEEDLVEQIKKYGEAGTYCRTSKELNYYILDKAF